LLNSDRRTRSHIGTGATAIQTTTTAAN
jgi:hypothetical protein